MSGKRGKNKGPTYETEKKPFPNNLSVLMSERKITQEMLASAVGVKRQTISLYKTGQSTPDIEQLTKIAQYFNVSADWLLGLSNVSSRNETLQSIGNSTGLHEHAITILLVEQDIGEKDIQNFISYLITHPKLADLIDALKQKNTFAGSGKKFPFDTGNGYRFYDVEIEAVCKKIVDDLSRDIMDGYTDKYGDALN